jgi:hypothetical protein
MTDNRDVDQHPAMLVDISKDCPNTIRILQSLHPIHRFTCLMHALDFTERPEYVQVAELNVYAGAEFARWLLDGRLNPASQSELRDGDLVFYLPGGKFKHVGLSAVSGRVTSKWGVGHHYEHGLFEVPISYGDNVAYFRQLPYDEAYHLFTQFAEQNGIRFE